MANVAENFQTVCDCRTFVRRGGAGRSLLFLHGAGGLPGWQPFLAQLADRYDVIAPDHPGYGQSDTPAWLEEVPIWRSSIWSFSNILISPACM